MKIYILVFVSLFFFFLCVWVEMLNIKHGNYLPRADIFEGANNNKWRDLSEQSAKRRWRHEHLYPYTEDYLTETLTDQQKEEQDRFVSFNRFQIFFHDLVRYSVFLYFVLPILSVLTILFIQKTKSKKDLVLLRVSIVIHAICYYFMITRSYFSAIFS